MEIINSIFRHNRQSIIDVKRDSFKTALEKKAGQKLLSGKTIKKLDKILNTEIMCKKESFTFYGEIKVADKITHRKGIIELNDKNTSIKNNLINAAAIHSILDDTISSTSMNADIKAFLQRNIAQQAAILKPHIKPDETETEIEERQTSAAISESQHEKITRF